MTREQAEALLDSWAKVERASEHRRDLAAEFARLFAAEVNPLKPAHALRVGFEQLCPQRRANGRSNPHCRDPRGRAPEPAGGARLHGLGRWSS
jgi:hypothetical protein